MSPRPDKYIGLDLTLIEYIKTFKGLCLESWGVSKMIQMYYGWYKWQVYKDWG